MKIYYQFLGHIISLSLPDHLSIHTLKQHIPHISETFSQKENISIAFIQSNHSNISYDLDNLTIYDTWQDSWLIDMPHIIYSYLKYVFFHKNIYFVHSCLIDNCLFIGASGAGKTTLCIEAINKNLTISSLDRTCIMFNNNTIFSLAGTDILSVRPEQKQPMLTLKFSNKERNLYQYDIHTSDHIDDIFIFQINDSIKKIKIEGISVVHQLFPFFIDCVKSDCFLKNGQLLFSPIYSEKQKKILFQQLATLKNSVYFKSGSVKDIL